MRKEFLKIQDFMDKKVLTLHFNVTCVAVWTECLCYWASILCNAQMDVSRYFQIFLNCRRRVLRKWIVEVIISEVLARSHFTNSLVECENTLGKIQMIRDVFMIQSKNIFYVIND